MLDVASVHGDLDGYCVGAVVLMVCVLGVLVDALSV